MLWYGSTEQILGHSRSVPCSGGQTKGREEQVDGCEATFPGNITVGHARLYLMLLPKSDDFSGSRCRLAHRKIHAIQTRGWLRQKMALTLGKGRTASKKHCNESILVIFVRYLRTLADGDGPTDRCALANAETRDSNTRFGTVCCTVLAKSRVLTAARALRGTHTTMGIVREWGAGTCRATQGPSKQGPCQHGTCIHHTRCHRWLGRRAGSRKGRVDG